ncbi:MAG: RNA polymerase sigma factor [Bacteroidales bacterium]|nr:RNA polymerase sigma factor [Bacteroidales bacterium]
MSNRIKVQETQNRYRVANNSNNKEEKLIKRLIAGEESAYRQVMDKYRQPVIRLCRGFTGSSDDAEDLAQEVFLEVLNSIEKFKGHSSISTWIYRIAVNKSLNFVRDRSKRSHDNYTREAYGESNDGNSYSADKRLTQKEHAEALHNALDSIPSAQRTAFVLSKYEDMKYYEIAEVMKTSVSAVESLLFRAKKNLQERLFEYYKKNLE